MPSATPLGAARERERGQILVLFAFVLIALLLVSALAVDYGGWLLARRSYQNIADEAAIAGAYQLTSSVNDDCAIGGGVSKQQCARQSAWESIKSHTGLGVDPATQAVSIGDTPYVEAGYRIWVASPPSDAGSAYTGLASSDKTIFVRVERDVTANLSRIIRPSTTVGAWATAGRIPENFAIITLCGPPTCTPPSGNNIKIAGTGSNLILETGDLGSNSFGKTSGNSASIALGPESAAYMHYPGECAVGSSTCQIDSWTSGGGVDTSALHSALALPQVIDPKYNEPGCSVTANDCAPYVSPYNTAYVPWQCYSTTDTPPAVAMTSEPFADGPDLNGAPIDLAGAVQPPTDPPVLLGAITTVTGTVTAAVGGAKINGILVTYNPGNFNNTTSGGGPNAGKYSIPNVTVASGYTITATDATNVYHTYTESGVNVTAGLVKNFSINKNPVVSGTVTDLVTGLPIVGATITFTGGTGAPYSVTTGAGGTYSKIITNASTYTATGSATSYASTSYSVTTTLDNNNTLNFSLNPNDGTITGLVKDSSTNNPISGATVTISGAGTAITNASGIYTLGVTAGSHTVFASASGYGTSGTVTVSVGAAATVTQNFSLVPSATLTGTITDDTTGLPLAGATVAITTGSPTGNSPVTTNAAGVYTITGLQSGNYRFQASLSGYTSKTSSNTSVSGNTTASLTLWPDRCGVNNASKGKWDCGNGSGGCPAVTNAPGVNVSCAAFDNTNRIRPGTYKDITISSGQCAWIDPLGGTPGLTGGQKAGVVYVTDNISIGSGAFLFGDGVTIVLDKNASFDVNNSGGFVLNYYDSARTYNGSNWRTGSYIGGTGVTYCSGDDNNVADLRKGAWTTKTRYAWTGSGTSWCYDDQGSASSTFKGEIGMTWFLRGDPPNSNSHRFDLSGAMGFLFDGVLYGPKDNIGLGGQGAQASAGQIVAWTITYSGDTDIHQRYSGIEVDGPPYLIEPYIGE